MSHMPLLTVTGHFIARYTFNGKVIAELKLGVGLPPEDEKAVRELMGRVQSLHEQNLTLRRRLRARRPWRFPKW